MVDMDTRDVGLSNEVIEVGASIPMQDVIHYKSHWTIEKYEGDFHSPDEAKIAGVSPYEVLEFDGNLLLNEGITNGLQLWTTTGTPTAWATGNAYIGVGDNSQAAANTDTGLIAATNIKYNAMTNSSYPSVTGQTATWQSTFASADANFHWQEITVSTTSLNSGINLNRKVQDMGTKASGTSWVASLAITLS